MIVYNSEGWELQYPTMGSLEMPQPSAHLPMLDIAPAHPREMVGVLRESMNPGA